MDLTGKKIVSFAYLIADLPLNRIEMREIKSWTYHYRCFVSGDDNSLVHGVLTEDSLFDGTISTNVEHYYVEPARRYSTRLTDLGIHSVVYKVSDVIMKGGNTAPDHCASEVLHRKRRKRWLPEELAERSNPPLPLDLDVPYNDDMSLVQRGMAMEDTDGEDQGGGGHGGTNQKPEYTGNVIISRTARPTSHSNSNTNSNNNYNSLNNNRNILYNEYHPSQPSNTNNNGEINVPRNANRNIIGNVFERKRNNFFANSSSSSSTTHASRPVHKNHVEIITKRPNIIVNNYNPDVVLMHPLNPSPTNIKHQNINLNVRNELLERTRSLYDRKSTCMLYLQADHTFFQKMGSDEASIEAITRHVQRANVIYKNTGEFETITVNFIDQTVLQFK